MRPRNDLFYAMSHGVNRAILKKGIEDNRVKFLDRLIKKLPNINMIFMVFQINNQYGEMILIMLLQIQKWV